MTGSTQGSPEAKLVSTEHERLFPVIEIFGPVLQGEGALIGAQTHFVRFGACDFRCSWCDSLYAVLPEEVKKNSTQMSADRIIAELRELGTADWVTLSGGNPALHYLSELVPMLKKDGYKVAVETQGSMWRFWMQNCTMVTVSPKPPSSGMECDFTALQLFDRYLDNSGAEDLPQWNLKVVVFDNEDLEFARHVHEFFPHVPFYLQVGNKVGEFTRDVLLNQLDWLFRTVSADYPTLRDARILPQLHVLLYGNKRGV